MENPPFVDFFFWKNIGFHIFLYVYPRVPGGKLQEPKPLLIGSTLRLFTLSSGRHPFECIPWLPKPSETSFILWILHSSLKGDHHVFYWPVRATRRLEMSENQLKISEWWWNRLAKGFPLTLAQDHYDTEQAHLIFFSGSCTQQVLLLFADSVPLTKSYRSGMVP